MGNVYWFTEKPIAHRGWHWEDGVDENSIEAIELAMEKGYPIEFDIHLSRDGHPFIHHDLDLKRMTTFHGKGTDLSRDDLKNIKTHQSSSGIPFLDDVLKLVKGKVPLVIELKRSAKDDRLEKQTLSLLNSYRGDFSLQSFHPQTLRYLRENGSGAPIGLLSGPMDSAGLDLFSKILIKSLCLTPYLKPNYIGYQWDHINKRAPQKMRTEFDIPLLGWTVKEERGLQFCKRWADNIIFENPIVQKD